MNPTGRLHVHVGIVKHLLVLCSFVKESRHCILNIQSSLFPLRAGFLGSLPGRTAEERRRRRGQNVSAAGQDVRELPVESQEDNAALLLRAGTGEAHAEDSPRGPAAGVQRALRPAGLRPLRPPGAGQGLQAAGARRVRRGGGAHV